MKNDENDIIDIPTELKIDEPKPQVENLEQVAPQIVTESQPVDNLSQETIMQPVTNEISQPQINIAQPVIMEENLTNNNQNIGVAPQIIPEVSMPTPPTQINAETPSNIEQPSELNAISLTNVENKVESIDGNPDTLDIKVKGIDDEKPNKSKKFIKIIILIIVAIVLLGVSGFIYYNYLVSKKNDDKPVNKEPLLEIVKLSTISSFEEAYNKVPANFNTNCETQNFKYLVNNGILEVTKGDQTFKLSIKDVNITMVSNLKTLDDKEIIGLKDDKENYYFAHIDLNIDKDAELDYQNNKLLTINNDGSIKNIAIADYLNNKGYFYLAEKNNDNFFIGENEGNITTISEVYLNVYNGINIDFNDLSFKKNIKDKLNIDGVGLFYDGTLYMYKGDIKNIEELEIKDGENSLNCSNIYLTYREDLKYLDLYIVTTDDTLYQMDLLSQEFDDTKINLKRYDSKVVDQTLLESDGIYLLELKLENGEKISVK